VKLAPDRYPKLINYYHPFLMAALIAGGWFRSITPLGAVEVSRINNQAIGSYEDPDSPADPKNPNDLRRINITSNLLQITVQEVAGMIISSKGVTNEQGATLNTIVGGDRAYFRFDVQNTGNDSTRVFIPNAATLTGGVTFQQVQYLEGSTWKDVPPGGLTSSSIPAGGSIQVRVVVQVDRSASGEMSVSLGKTATPNLQNQERGASSDQEDVYSIDNTDNENPSEVNGAPANGTREAMATQTVTLGAQFQAFAQVKQTSTGYAPSDNSITYNLSLEVLATAPPGVSNLQATDLVGTNLNLDGGVRTGILVSEAIPLGTKYLGATPPTNGNWIVVYQYGNPIGATDRADTAIWFTQPPTGQAIVQRVGFFLPESRITRGTTVSGFNLKVNVINPLTTQEVNSIAQVFGATPANPKDPQDQTSNLNRPVFDESGDNNANNYNDDGQPGPLDANGQPLVSPGIIDASVPVEDPRHPSRVQKDDNGGKGENGEYLSVEIATGKLSILFNGPRGVPTAKGSTDDNDDFTNKTSPVPAGVRKGDQFNPPAVEFINTVQNAASFATNVKLIPQLKPGETLPPGTKVKLKKDANDSGVSFTLQEGQFVPDDAAKPALVLVGVDGNTGRDYITTIDLPAETVAVNSYPLILTAFFDLNNNDRVDSGEPQNQTIDRVYSGFIDFLKESRVLAPNQQPINDANGQFSTAAKTAQPGQYIEYRIKFKNISEVPPENSGSKGISASKFEIIEDGDAAPNNWGSITENVPASAQVSPGTVEFSPVNDTNSLTVTKYTHKVGTLAPQTAGQFSFIRKVK
jgi:hypothetical protein